MKKLVQLILTITFMLTLFLSNQVIAQAPEKMSYQSVIRGANNVLVTNQNIRLQISILQGSVNGSAVYVEQHQTATNSNGLVTISIGDGSSQSSSFSSINWANGPYFVKMEADPTGGTNYTVSGTSQLLSVPYALHAKTAESIVGGSSAGGGFTHYIGEEFGGGVIFHLWKDAQGAEHGLIVDKTDFNDGQAWSNVIDTIGAAARSNWDGLSNSNAIVAQAGHTISAAALCLNSNNGGQNDWYLPSIDELSILWSNRYNVNKSLSTIGGATVLNYEAYYWSSTESFTTVLNINFYTGDIYNSGFKSNPFNVRAIRAF